MARASDNHAESSRGRWHIWVAAGGGAVLISAIAVGAYLGGGSSPGSRKECTGNLETIGRAAIRYAETHQGNFPPSLVALLQAGGEITDAKQLACPNSDKKGRGGGYVYIAGRTRKDDPNAILAYEPLGNHKKNPGGNVLLVSGVVRWLDEKQHEAALAQTKPRPGAK